MIDGRPAKRPQAPRLPQPEFARSACRFCGRPIVWGIGPDGQTVPLDPVAVVYAVKRVGEYVKCKPAPDYLTRALEDIGVAMYVTHWATCRNVEAVKAWQKSKHEQLELPHSKDSK